MDISELLESSIAPSAEGATVVPIFGEMKVAVKSDAPKDKFVEFVKEWTDGEHGEFMKMPLEELAKGQSYITLGAWLGDQRVAFMFLGLGVHHGAWEIISPDRLGIEGEQAAEMAGLGFILNSGINPEFQALLDA